MIIPTHRRPERLEACLKALSGLDYPKDRFEIIVVDDGSPASSEPVILPFRGVSDITLLTQPRSGPAAARNRGAAHAKGTFLAFTDDDCTPDPGWLKALANRFAALPEHMIGGRTINALPENPFSGASQHLISYLYDYYDGKPSGLFTSNNMAVPVRHFYSAGVFDASFPLAAGEDRDFCDRWLHHGYKMTYAPEAVVYHAHALTLSSFWRQHFNYGRGAFHFHRLRVGRGHRRIKPEPLSFYLNLLRYPLSRERGLQGLLIASLLGISQAANAAGFFWERSSRKSDS